MEETSYSYKKSFSIDLIFCGECKAYYNMNEPHNCSRTPQPKIDVMDTIRDNLTKVKPRKRIEK